MSLIRQRKTRKKTFIDVRGGMSTGKLVVLFVLVILIIWYLGRF